MATTITFDNQPRTVPAVRVFLRVGWTDDWVEQKHLHCDWVLFAANPDMGKAQFTWHFGRLFRSTVGDWETPQPLDVLRRYVKVEIDDPDDEDTPIRWYGVMEEDSTADKGKADVATIVHKSGTQTLVAYSLDFLLSRQILLRSVVMGPVGDEITLERAVEFNARSQLDSLDEKVETGNRSADVTAGGTHVFARDLATATFWSTLDAGQYLLTHQVPANESGTNVIPWQFGLTALLGDVPNWDKPRVACHGRSLRDVLNELVDRRRLLGWTARLADPEENNIAELATFTFTPVDLEYDGNTIPANTFQFALVFDADTAVQLAFVGRHTLEAVDQVTCVGARAIACFTISPLSDHDTLERGWTDAQQADYEAGASGIAGYGAMEIWEQEERNKQARSRHEVSRVFSYFTLPSTWDGYTWTTGALDAEAPYFWDPNFAVPQPPLPHYYPQLRFRNHLPLKTDHDYTGDKIGTNTVTDATPTGQKWEYRPLLVLIELTDTDPVRYQAINDLAVNTEHPQPALGTADGIKWSASVRPQQDAPGIVININGQPQFAIASADFSPLPVDEADIASFSWNGLIATVAMDVDAHCTGKWPSTPATSESVRRLVIDVGDEYQQHFVAKGTVVGVAADGSLQQCDDGGFIRDDSAKLTALAQLVYEWYKTERQQVSLSLGYVTGKLRVGDLITTISQGDELKTVNTSVTALKYEFTMQEGATPTSARTSISTQFAEFDVRKFVHG